MALRPVEAPTPTCGEPAFAGLGHRQALMVFVGLLLAMVLAASPIGAVALTVTGVVPRLPAARTRARIDRAGAVLVTATVTCLGLLTSRGATRYTRRLRVIVGLATATVVPAAPWFVSPRRVAEPTTPVRPFRDPIFPVAAAAGFVLGVARFGAVGFLPLLLRIVTGATATNARLRATGHLVASVLGRAHR